VKELGFWGRGARLSVSLVLLALSCPSGSNSASFAQTSLATSSSYTKTDLSSDGRALLLAAVSAGRSPDLRWPDFSDYRKHVEKFYDFNQESLWWVKGMEPTTQAQQVIALLIKAGQKGLSADDYDGPRWNDRLAKLKPVTRQPAEADAVRFDLALTVCVMRY